MQLFGEKDILSVVETLYQIEKPETEDKVAGFDTGEDFEAAWQEINEE